MVCESHEHGLTYGLVLAVGDERARRSVSPGHATSITEGGMRNELAVLQQARATRRAWSLACVHAASIIAMASAMAVSS